MFQNIVASVETPIAGQLFSSPDTTTNAVCSSNLGRACQVNGFGSSGNLGGRADTGFLANFAGKNIASAAAYTTVVSSVTANAGQGKL